MYLHARNLRAVSTLHEPFHAGQTVVLQLLPFPEQLLHRPTSVHNMRNVHASYCNLTLKHVSRTTSEPLTPAD